MSRLNEQQINEQLNNKLLKYYNSPYIGEVPKGIINYFKEALFTSAPINHQIHVIKIRQIVNKKESELLIGEVGMISKTLVGCPMYLIYKDFDEAMDYHEGVEKLTIKYNADLDNFQKSLEKERMALNQLANPNNGNGMRIITQN